MMGLPAMAQERIISGTVKDENGQGLPGVSILIKGTQNGTSTDPTGQYKLSVKPEDVLIVSYLGYLTQSIPVGTNTTLDIQMQPDALNLEEITVVGSRNQDRTILETAVPVDVIPIQQVLNAVGQIDIQQIMQFVAPSFNSNRQAGADGSDHIDAATLRGMGPDQVLVLVNGKRRHSSSLVNVFGSRGRGNVGTDLNTIPAAAIERIEVLRDGASAQYGSDAIAGVINIVLKKNVDEISINASTGKYSEGDGTSVLGNANYGVKVGEKGFINLSGEVWHRDKTDRAPEGNPRVIGDAEVTNANTFFNASLPFDSKSEFYAFGGLNYREGKAGAWARAADDEVRNVPEIYPNGFVPRIDTRIVDNSLGIGIKSEYKGWKVDFSNTYGRNSMFYRVEKSLNASLLAASKTSFDAGGFNFRQNTTNLDFTRNFPEILSGLNVAFGSEYRIDNYQIVAGEEASWKNYGFVQEVVNGELVIVDKLGKAGGAQGFPGFRPENEVNRSRSNVAGYIDTELDFSKKFMLGAAIRAERYSDFGNTLNGKLAFKASPSEKFSIRGSVSTGFRAPSLHQSYFNSTYTDFIGGKPADVILTPNNGNVAKALGIPTLKEETSQNFSLGFTSKPVDNLSITVDGYLVNVDDRIVLTGYFADDDPDIGDILKTLNVQQASFFTNAVDTRTKGLDVIITHDTQLGKGKLNTTFAMNFNQQEVLAVHTSAKLRGKEETYFGEREKLFVEGSAPKMKGNLTLNYNVGKFGIMARGVYFGKVEMGTWSGTANGVANQIYNPKTTVDLSLSLRMTEKSQITIGGTNIFDVYPDKQNPDETETGGMYEAVQMGFNGAYFFGRIGVKF
ncbi:MAG: TonB-dependent receptor [Flammeovirgaceae bacterium]